MRKKFLVNLVFIVLVNLLIKPIAIFAIDAKVQNIVGSEAYGLYFSLLNLTVVFNIVLDLGLTNYIIKSTAQQNNMVIASLMKLMPLKLILFFIYAIFVYLIAFSVGFQSEHYYMLLLLILNQAFITFIIFFRGFFAGSLKFYLDIIFSALDKFILIIVCAYFLYFNPVSSFSITDFIEIQTFSYILTFILSGIIFFLLNKNKRITFDFPFYYSSLKKAFPFALIFILMMLYTRTDSILLERLHPDGANQAGIYAQGFRILDAMYMFAALFASLLFPMFSNLIAKKEAFEPLLKTSLSILVLGGGFFVIILFFKSDFLLGLIYDHVEVTQGHVFEHIILSFIAMTYTLIIGTLMTSYIHLKQIILFSSIGLVLNFVANLVFIPFYGITAVSEILLLTQVLVAVLHVLYAIFKLKIKGLVSNVIKQLLILMSTFLLAYYLKEVSIVLFASILLLFLVISVVITKMLALDDVKRIKLK